MRGVVFQKLLAEALKPYGRAIWSWEHILFEASKYALP